MMKRAFIYKCIFFFVILSSFSACHQLDRLTKFNLDQDYEIEVPSMIGLDLPFDIPIPETSITVDNLIEMDQPGMKLVEDARITALEVTITEPEKESFDFLKSIEIFIEAEGLEPVKLGRVGNIPDYVGQKLKFFVNDKENLEAFIKRDEFNLRTELIVDKIILREITIAINVSFKIDTKIMGI